MSRRIGTQRKFRTMFINGRSIERNDTTLTPEAFDLSECGMHKTLTEAVDELIARIVELPAIAPYLQTLLCKVDREGSIIDYTPVRSGAVVQAIMSAQKNHG